MAAAERVAGDRPDRLQHGRAHPARGEHLVEMAQMALFLLGHARDQPGRGMAVAEHRELAGVDPGRAIFAGLVDAQH